MNPAQYAEHRGKELRTVRRWLRDGWLPGAVQYPDGRWDIPRDAIEQKPLIPPAPRASRNGQAVSPDTSGVVSVTRHGDMVAASSGGQAVGLADALDKHPALLSLEEASRLLGIPETAIRRHADHLGAVPWGPRGTLVVPARVVRELAGL
jgi:hypothetical protein